MTALGLIETKGLLAAIEGADAMLKAADVRLLEKILAGGGLVTITIAGEVAAVRASVDAATSAIRRISGACLVSGHVIARPYGELANIVNLQPCAPATPAVQVASTVAPAAPTAAPAAKRQDEAQADLTGSEKAPIADKKSHKKRHPKK